ncbi:MAG: alpha/beta fold hydrolase [Candidatus Firestonebacteria bacterium]|nr:alpha/beta fold hydrolase [Candidatus Firestonebacteria bacterium]
MINNDENVNIPLNMDDLIIDQKKYLWTKNILEFLEKSLKINIKMHDVDNKIKDGNIFVFNHFSRLETFLPQYLFYNKEGVVCRSIAARQFFNEEKVSKYLKGIGAVPTDLPNIIDFLAKESLKEIKIIIFPEGGMIKDKKVLSSSGELSVYSRELHIRREPHTGSAVIAIKAQRYKDLFLLAYKNKDWDLVERYRENFSKELSIEDINVKCQAETFIVPVNITFYPIRITENFVTKIINIFSDIKNSRVRDEMLIESNILLKDTDMDLTFGAPIPVSKYLTNRDKQITNLFYHFESIKNSKRRDKIEQVVKKILKMRSQKISIKMRDDYMNEIYRLVTINPLHLLSELLIRSLGNEKEKRINKRKFIEKLYLAIKIIQHYKQLHFHRDMINPERYYSILDENNGRVNNFLEQAESANLIHSDGNYMILSDNLLQKHSFDEIRIKNTPLVISNEAQPIHEISDTITSLLKEKSEYINSLLVDFLIEDENTRYQNDLNKYQDEKYVDINILEKNNLPGNTFFLKQPKNSQKNVGILLIHGFSSSPQEMKYFGDIFFKKGYSVLGIRLTGHGTTPYDLAHCEWEDWYSSVERGYKILSAYSDNIIPIGFSMGGTLALRLASYEKYKIAGTVTISSPILLRDSYGRYLFLLPVIDKINNLIKSFSEKSEGVINFIPSDPENKNVNYKHMPLKGIYELMKLINIMRKDLKNIQKPLLIIQADEDYEVDSESANIIYNEAGSIEKTLYFIKSTNHVIITEKFPEVVEKILEFVKGV